MTWHIRGILVFVSALLYGFTLSAQTTANPAKQTGDIRGSVMEVPSKEPIKKALVVLNRGQESAIGTYTDATGKFELHDIDPGTYTLSAERDGFIADPKTESATVTVSAGARADAAALLLARTGAVSGHILDSSGEPVTGAAVQLQSLKTRNHQLATVGYGTSDDRGIYRAYNIPPGKYKLAVTDSMRGQAPIKIQLEPDSSKTESMEPYGTTYYPGTLDPARAVTVQIDPGADLQGMDVTLLHTKTVHVRGHVSALGTAPPLIMVVLSSMSNGSSLTAQVRANGEFEVLQVPPGKYDVGALAMLEHGNQIAAHQELEVNDTDIDGLQLTLSHPQIVTGKIVLPPNRKMPPGMLVFLRPKGQVEGQPVSNGASGLAEVHEDGSFSNEGVLGGDYDVALGTTGKGDDLYVSSMRSGNQDIFAGLHIGASAPSHLEIVLKANGAEIDCNVLRADQKPLPDAQVMLVPDRPRAGYLALRGECHTDASGNCALLGVAPGEYHAFAFPKSAPLDLEDLDTAALVEKSGTSITVSENDKKQVQLELVQLDQDN